MKKRLTLVVTASLLVGAVPPTSAQTRQDGLVVAPGEPWVVYQWVNNDADAIWLS